MFDCRSGILTALIASLSPGFGAARRSNWRFSPLRHQIGVLQRSAKRLKLTSLDHFLWEWLCAVWQDWNSGVFIMKASTVVGWQRKRFRLLWTWKIRREKPGRPAVPKEVRELLIRTMSRKLMPLFVWANRFAPVLERMCVGLAGMLRSAQTGLSHSLGKCRRACPTFGRS